MKRQPAASQLQASACIRSYIAPARLKSCGYIVLQPLSDPHRFQERWFLQINAKKWQANRSGILRHQVTWPS